ncbi:putative HLH transcription factor [Zalerion maritima]|uniref:HLH transcription factor n=1 Tax=Zalerion maritima TaxID=339359 RepID=A0AAD5RI22_9PEZI|nr:putative HLH transcription factor [Zalerion maritima]
MSIIDNQRPASQKFPGALSGILNAPEENRDSAYYSANDPSSKHTSAASIGLLNSGYTSVHDKTPSPTTATTAIPQPLVSPSSNMSVASMVSPTTLHSGDLRRFETSSNSTLNGNPDPEARRGSVDSRMNHNFGEMRLGGSNSPYASHNHSTTSIQGTLTQQRNPRPGYDHQALAVHRISNGYQPNAERNPDAHNKAVRTAPAITGPTTGSIARAAEPIKGQAWAFPEEGAAGAQSNYIDSRRSSIASVTSSQFTTDSRLPPLPPGQRNLPDQDFARMSAASGDFPAVHHHTIQHKQIGELQTEENSPQTGTQPYSRTPELRVSHKLAERKRRTEMKELFEQLKDLMPQERGSKASKWEILTKAISEHQRQNEALRQWQAHCGKQQADIDALRHELHLLRTENERLRGDQGSTGARPAPQQAVPPPAPYGPEDPYTRQARPELPPLRSISNGGGAPESMTGVQYDAPRPTSNGYRPGPPGPQGPYQ